MPECFHHKFIIKTFLTYNISHYLGIKWFSFTKCFCSLRLLTRERERELQKTRWCISRMSNHGVISPHIQCQNWNEVFWQTSSFQHFTPSIVYRWIDGVNVCECAVDRDRHHHCHYCRFSHHHLFDSHPFAHRRGFLPSRHSLLPSRSRNIHSIPVVFFILLLLQVTIIFSVPFFVLIVIVKL